MIKDNVELWLGLTFARCAVHVCAEQPNDRCLRVEWRGVGVLALLNRLPPPCHSAPNGVRVELRTSLHAKFGMN